MASWNLDQLKSTLSGRKEVKAWVVSQEHVHRRERYFLSDSGPGKTQGPLAIDQDREARSQNVSARIFVKLAREGRQGEITKKLFQALPLQPQLDAAIDAALQTDHQSWELPSEMPRDLPRLSTTDPKMAEDLERAMAKMTAEVAQAVSKKRPTAFNSAELFLSVHDRELHLSNGLVHRSSQSRVYTEAAYSMTRKDPKSGALQSDEYLSTAWSVSGKDLSIEKLFDETAERAEHSLDVTKPETGKYPVIVDAEVLATLLSGHIGQLSGLNAYNRLPFVKPGDFNTDGSLDCENDGLSRRGLDGARRVAAGSVLMVCIGATIGKCGYCDRDVTTNQQINALTPAAGVSHKLIYYQMLTESFQGSVMHSSAQATLPIINKKKWSALTVVLPPKIEEQRRIVAKLDALSTETQRLESLYQQKQAALAALKKSLLHQAFNGAL